MTNMLSSLSLSPLSLSLYIYILSLSLSLSLYIYIYIYLVKSVTLSSDCELISWADIIYLTTSLV